MAIWTRSKKDQERIEGQFEDALAIVKDLRWYASRIVEAVDGVESLIRDLLDDSK